ncbi:hypothetical protein EJ08DRAFT_653477 [Tothia fuscella]|uniref:tRNA(Phe) 7-[(3-amino-3-carboxypropyl)-4-demethylwyosine(37)-N(4)]-methyltransferase n=1 Tax=Tothia fuscella TaxID=1048955 RepID=A0A9P4TT05_9PEZI|nr:hypothetical protein EJ08DRAFT_653477 [Tothia fuscella]
MSTAFQIKKQRILEQLTVPSAEYSDRSPKGSIDEGIRDLVDEINAIPGLVTTSSCAGRISVFLEGKKKSASLDHEDPGNSDTHAIGGPGGKGGGRWLFVSHDPVPADPEPNFHTVFSMQPSRNLQCSIPSGVQLVHLKFEAMILHLLTSSIKDAQIVLSAASTAGFRESGAMGLSANHDTTITPMIAVRSTGLSFDTIIGYKTTASESEENDEIISTVTEEHLKLMVNIANERFEVNSERIQRFRNALVASQQRADGNGNGEGPEWEDKAVRIARKREEGLERQRFLREENEKREGQGAEEVKIGLK